MPPEREWVNVENVEAARFLCQPGTACLLKPFMRGETTLAQAAQELGLPLNALHYRAKLWCRAGLLEIVREQPRRGRPVKMYRAVSRSFLVPAHLLADHELSALVVGSDWVSEIREAAARYATAPRVAAVKVYLRPNGALEWAFEWDERRSALIEHPPGLLQLRSAALFLDSADAEELATKLLELYELYKSRQGAKRYGLLLDLVPLPRPVDAGEGEQNC